MPGLEIKKYPDPVLRKEAEEVLEIDESILDLINNMFEIMDDEGGIGLAAPQIGTSKKIIVISQNEKGFEKFALINPVIEFFSEEKDVMEEGCLSLPGINADVERSSNVIVKGITRNGRVVEVTASGMLARVLQHEIDHLNGVLFIDRLKGEDKRRIEEGLEDLRS